eukprot:NODE_1145_length_2021_cov_1.193548.p1 type:complete len:300 gc:universal NODE_1145_length_2021_cov_1.193548:1397-498(-)
MTQQIFPNEVLLEIFSHLPFDFNYYIVNKSCFEYYFNRAFTKFKCFNFFKTHRRFNGYFINDPMYPYREMVKEITIIGDYELKSFPFFPNATILQASSDFPLIANHAPKITQLTITCFKESNLEGIRLFNYIQSIHFKDYRVPIDKFIHLPTISNLIDLQFDYLTHESIQLIPCKFPKTTHLQLQLAFDIDQGPLEFLATPNDVIFAIELILNAKCKSVLKIDDFITISNYKQPLKQLYAIKHDLHVYCHDEMFDYYFDKCMQISILKYLLSDFIIQIHNYDDYLDEMRSYRQNSSESN